LENQIQQLRY